MLKSMKAGVVACVLGLTMAQAAWSANCAMPANAAETKAEIGALVNAQRTSHGRTALTENAALDKAAQSHACWMAKTGNFSHKGRGGSGPMARTKSAGYCTRLTAENIAMGYSSAGQVVNGWLTSSGHLKNIMLRKTRNYGLGVAMMNGKPAWVMVYAKPC